MEQTIDKKALRRLHIGGLSCEVTVDDLKEKFSSFGAIQDVEIKTKKDVYGDDFNTFAYIDIKSDESALNKCFSIFNKAKWKGRSLQIHLAKEHFLKRLDEERKNPIIPVVKKVKTNFHNPLALLPEVEDFNIKGKVPGTPIPGEKKWVVGKYGRILPIVNVRNRSLNKKLKEEEENERLIDIDELTWKIETDTYTGSSKRRCGDFSDFDRYVPKRVKLDEDYWSDEMQEKMEELRRRYLEKNSEENPKKIEDDIEIVKSEKTVSSDYHIPKSDFIYDSDEELSNNKDEFQHLSVLGEATSCGYDSAGSADTDEIIAMNASRNLTSSSKNSVANLEEIIPVKKSVVNEIDSKPKINQEVIVGDKITLNSKPPVKTEQEIEIALSYVDNAMKQIPFRGIAMLDCVSIKALPKTTMKSESDSESVTTPDGEPYFDNSASCISKLYCEDRELPNAENIKNSGPQHSVNDSEYDSDDFEKVALKYTDSLPVLKDSDLKLIAIKTKLPENYDSNKMLTASDSEDTDDMIKKLKNTNKTTKLIVTDENCSNETVTNINHLKHSDTSMPLNIQNESDFDSDDFEKVAEKYSSIMVRNTTSISVLKDFSKSVDVTTQKSEIVASETSEINDDEEGSTSESDIEVVIKDRNVKSGNSMNTPAKELIQELIGCSKIIHETDDDSKVDNDNKKDDDSKVDDVSDYESSDLMNICERNKTECNNTDNRIEESKDDVKETDRERIASSDDESSNDEDSDSDDDSDSADQSDGEDATNATNNGDQADEETNSSDDSDDNDESDKDDDDDNDDSDKDSDDDDDDDDDNKESDNSDEEEDEDEENKNDEEGNEDSQKEEDEEDTSQRNKNFFVSSSLFSAFVKPEKDVNSGFSFLKTFGNQNIPEQKKLELPRNLRMKEETESFSNKSDVIEEKQTTKSSSSFFFQPKDIRLQEGVQFFHRKMDIDKIEEKWNEVKPVFLATCRQRNRLALKRLDQEKLKKRKMSFSTSFMSKNRK